MNWLQKIAQQWWERNPDFDVGNHLHSAFSIMLPEHSGDQWPISTEIYYSADTTYRYDFTGQHETNPNWSTKYQIAAFFFFFNNRMYRLNVLVNNGGNPVIYLKGHGFEGSLSRVYDNDLGEGLGTSKNTTLGDIKSNEPKDFVDQVIATIMGDRRNDNDDDDDDLFPEWPYPEGEYTDEPEEELSRVRAPRIRGYQ